MLKRIFILSLIAILICSNGHSQFLLPLNQSMTDRYSFFFYNDTIQSHTAIKPFTLELAIQKELLDTSLLYSDKENPLKALLNYDFVSLKNNNISFKLNPIIKGLYSFDVSDNIGYKKQKIGFSRRLNLFEKYEFFYAHEFNKSPFYPNTEKIDSPRLSSFRIFSAKTLLLYQIFPSGLFKRAVFQFPRELQHFGGKGTALTSSEIPEIPLS